MYIEGLFTIVKKWKQSKCLSIDEWLKMWYICVCIYEQLSTHMYIYTCICICVYVCTHLVVLSCL